MFQDLSRRLIENRYFGGFQTRLKFIKFGPLIYRVSIKELLKHISNFVILKKHKNEQLIEGLTYGLFDCGFFINVSCGFLQ